MKHTADTHVSLQPRRGGAKVTIPLWRIHSVAVQDDGDHPYWSLHVLCTGDSAPLTGWYERHTSRAAALVHAGRIERLMVTCPVQPFREDRCRRCTGWPGETT